MQGLSDLTRIIRNSAIIIIIVSVLAIIINFIHPNRIPLVAKQPYEIYVPCPDTIGEAKEIDTKEFFSLSGESAVIDARPREEFEKWHFSGAVNIPYDFLAPVCPLKIKEIVALKKRYVIVYGDGDEPDSGRELAKELSGKGIKNVYYLKGGVKNLKR